MSDESINILLAMVTLVTGLAAVAEWIFEKKMKSSYRSLRITLILVFFISLFILAFRFTHNEGENADTPKDHIDTFSGNSR